MANNFAQALAFVLSNEGGWYDGKSPRDPNPTMKGVTQAVYSAWRTAHSLPAASVEYIGDDELASIYTDYWTESGCGYTGPLTAVTLMDHAVNAGIGPAKRLLQRTLGVAADGVIGEATEAALAGVPDASLAASYCGARLNFYEAIAKANPALAPNLASWKARVGKFKAQFLPLQPPPQAAA